MKLFEQGDYILVDFDPTIGHEPNKMRPALIVSTGYFNNVLSSLAVVCPITSTANNHPLHIRIPDNHAISGYIRVEQLRAIDLIDRTIKTLEEYADEDTMDKVLTAIGGIFDI